MYCKNRLNIYENFEKCQNFFLKEKMSKHCFLCFGKYILSS